MTRPSAACLDRLENQANEERIKRLISQFDQFFVQAAKHSVELKAYQKLIAESEKNARSDPNSQHWLNQIEEKSLRQSQVQQAINQLITQAVQNIDQHVRAEIIAILRTLHADGFFDKPGKNSAASNSSSNPSSIALKTIEKNVNNERKEREESLTDLRKEFENHRTFNNDRYQQLQDSFENYKQSNETRLKNLEDTHRKQITSLKAALKLNTQQQQQQQQKQQQQQQQQNQSPQPLIEQPDSQQLKRLIHEQVKEQLPAIQAKADNIPITDLVSRQNFQTAISQIKDQIDQLSRQTTETLQEFEPQIKQITHAIQAQVIKSTKTVISDGHHDIAILIKDSIIKLQDQVDKLQPVVNTTSEKINQIESTHATLESQIKEKLNSKNLESQVKEKVHAELAGFQKQLTQLKENQTASEKKYNVFKGLQSGMSKLDNKHQSLQASVEKLEEIVTDAQSQFQEVERRIKPLQDRIDGFETSVQQNQHDHHHHSQRSSTPAQEANHQSSQSRSRTSQTPPSPDSHVSQAAFPTLDGYNQPPEPPLLRPSYKKGNRASVPASSAPASHSQNIPIASRLTNGPSQGGSQLNGERGNKFRKRTISRESSLSQSVQPPSGGAGGSIRGLSGAAALAAGGSSTHGYATQAVPYEQPPQPDHQNYGFPNPPHQVLQPTSSIPLAKRLKSDNNILSQHAYHDPYYNHNYDYQSNHYNHHHQPQNHQSQQQQPHPYPHKKSFSYAAKRAT
ncbi:hypothetical protein PCASD_12966 [Puccinia coronata f. sp. avenae]|uniref:Uncharacterized protein n=1 Tax=Puccinia coronata f. sp. avenae TaxID=200324 RepID=A0A2N5UAI9_9BASI|nr:hypothetical protein PCASD_22985 [Puccinia coronata f. sp. avenae]PLW34746.1 hypothetical protein PCASD_12966 [Puccinia coronata f. sp. avenae]